MKRSPFRRAFSMLETTIALGSAAILSVSLGASLIVASRGLELNSAPDGVRIDTARIAREMAQDLQLATRFTEQGSTAVSLLTPDRDGDGDPESIRYAWSGVAGAPLTYSLNGGAAVTVTPGVQSLQLNYSAQAMAAPAEPAESLTIGTKLLFVTAGTTIQATGTSASQRVAAAPMILVNPNANDRKKIELFESWGYDVTFILPTEPWSNMSALLDQSQLAFVSSESDGAAIPSGFYDSSKGIVAERVYQFDDAHFANNDSMFYETGLRVRSSSHYIMSGYSNSQFVPILSSTGPFAYFSNVGSGVTNLMGPSGRSEPAMMSLSPGDRMSNWAYAAGRRVLFPWGFPGLNYNNLTTQGLAITRRSLEWAAGAGSDPNAAVQTFGHTSVNMNILQPGPGKQVATKVQLAQLGDLKSISAFIGGPIGSVRYAIYSHSSGFNRPNILLAQSAAGLTSGGGSRWVTLPVSHNNLVAGEYWLVVSFGLSSQTVNMTPGGDYHTLNYDPTLLGFRTNWGASDTQEKMSFSIYATYTPD
jgi:hypothetical protein